MTKKKIEDIKPRNKGGRPKGSVAKHTLMAQEMRKEMIAKVRPKWHNIINNLIAIATNPMEPKAAVSAAKEILTRILGNEPLPLGIEDDSLKRLEKVMRGIVEDK